MIILSPVLSYDTVLHVRVFEYHLLKDTFVCELFLPLHEMLMQAAGKESIRKEEEGVQSARSNSPSSLADSGPGSTDKVQSMKSEKSSKIKSSKEAVPVGAVGGGGGVGVAEDAAVHSESSVRSHLGSITFENMFSNLMHSAHTPGTAKTCESEGDSDNEKSPTSDVAGAVSESAVSGPALAHSSYSLNSIEVPGASTVGTVGMSMGGSERKCASGGVKEVIQWHPCYGRQSDSETHIEKGEIYLGLQLERDA